MRLNVHVVILLDVLINFYPFFENICIYQKIYKRVFSPDNIPRWFRQLLIVHVSFLARIRTECSDKYVSYRLPLRLLLFFTFSSEKVLDLWKMWHPPPPPPFLSNVHVLRSSEPEKMVFANVSVWCLSVDFSLLAR